MWNWDEASPKLASVSKSQTSPPLDAQLLFAANVRRIRKAKGMTQEKLAEGANLHTNYVSSVERGQRNISIQSIERLARALEVPMAQLLSPAPDSPETESENTPSPDVLS